MYDLRARTSNMKSAQRGQTAIGWLIFSGHLIEFDGQRGEAEGSLDFVD